MARRAENVGTLVAVACVLLTAVVAALTAVSSLRLAGSGSVALGYIPASLEYPYNVAVAHGFEVEARRLGARVMLIDPRGSVERQANGVDDLIAQGAQGVAVLPLDGLIARSWVDKVVGLGVPFVSVVTLVGDPRTTAWKNVYPKLSALVGMDNVVAGSRAGELAASLLSHGRPSKIAIIEGAAGYPQVEQRTQGFERALKTAGVEFEIVSSQPTDWTPEKGEAVCQNVLSSHPDVDLIFSQADDMALGCARALHASGSRALLVATGGGSRLGIAAIRSGDLDGSVCDDPTETGALAARALYEAVTKGGPGKAQLISVNPQSITKANVAVCKTPW
jgi:ribose transport system substrate-binding protein